MGGPGSGRRKGSGKRAIVRKARAVRPRGLGSLPRGAMLPASKGGYGIGAVRSHKAKEIYIRQAGKYSKHLKAKGYTYKAYDGWTKKMGSGGTGW
jgi:hypothetical protein